MEEINYEFITANANEIVVEVAFQKIVQLYVTFRQSSINTGWSFVEIEFGVLPRWVSREVRPTLSINVAVS